MTFQVGYCKKEKKMTNTEHGCGKSSIALSCVYS